MEERRLMTGEGVDGVITAVNAAILKLQEMQSSLGVSKDRADEALRQVRIATKGSVRDEPELAISLINAAHGDMDRAIACAVRSVELLAQWTPTL